MPHTPDRRARLLEDLSWQARRLQVFEGLLNRGIAARLGINVTDLEVLGILAVVGPVSLARLAELTGLASGTVTLVADRLERDGFAHRAPDPSDRRKLLLEPVPERMREAGRFYDPLENATKDILEGYSDDEVELFSRAITRLVDAFHETSQVVRASDPAGNEAPGSPRP